MRSTLPIFMLICLLSAVHFQPTHSHLSPLLKGKGLGKGLIGKDAGGTALAAVISSRKLGLGLKAILFKPLLLVALAKIKLALLLGKPLALLAIKKLLLKAVLGKLLLKIPLILLKGKALLVKMLALKFALITKGLLGLKAPLAMLFLGACALGSGLGLALALGATLHKLKEGSEEEDYSYEEQGYALPPPRPAYGPPAAPAYSAPAPVYSPNPPYSSAVPVYSAAPAYSAPAPVYSPVIDGGYDLSQGTGFGANNLGNANGYGRSIRRKRDTADSDNDSEEDEESEEETIDESPEDLQIEFEAARTNGNAYLYMAAQFDEQSCGRRLMCEVYQKPHESLSEDEVLLQEIFGYPLGPLSEEEEGTPKEMYYRAAQLGASYQGRASSKACARFYPTCPHNAEQLIHIFVTEDIQNNEIDSDNRPVNHLQPPQTSARLPFYQIRQPTYTPAAQQPNLKPTGPQQAPAVKAAQQVRRPTAAVNPSLRQRFVAAPAA